MISVKGSHLFFIFGENKNRTMRIIGGIHKGFRFVPPKKTPARPTTDIAKEGLFNVLNNRYYFDDLKVLDLFGGTGNISYEFASRGCEDITSVELDRKNVEFIKQIAQKLEMPIHVIRGDVFKFMEKTTAQFDLIFAGPPYPLKTLATIPDKVFEHQLLKEDGILIMEHNPNHNFEDHPKYVEHRKYGTTIFCFFQNKSDENEVKEEE